jgi:hypothetical protein
MALVFSNDYRSESVNQLELSDNQWQLFDRTLKPTVGGGPHLTTFVQVTGLAPGIYVKKFREHTSSHFCVALPLSGLIDLSLPEGMRYLDDPTV